jgi:hypothetical protein
MLQMNQRTLKTLADTQVAFLKVTHCEGKEALETACHYIPKLFWFKLSKTLKIFHAPPSSTVSGNQVTNCKT